MIIIRMVSYIFYVVNVPTNLCAKNNNKSTVCHMSYVYVNIRLFVQIYFPIF